MFVVKKSSAGCMIEFTRIRFISLEHTTDMLDKTELDFLQSLQTLQGDPSDARNLIRSNQ
jgi:hypothetical protein